MAVVPANNGPEQYGVVCNAQSRTVFAADQDGAVAMQQNTEEGTVTRRTSSGEQTFSYIKRSVVIALERRCRNCVQETDDYMQENHANVEDYLAHTSCGEACADVLCQACGSNLCSCKFSRIIKPERILSASLRKSRNLGMKFLFSDGLIFPLLNHIVRDLVVSGELLYTIVGLILSIVNYINADCHRVFNVVNFVFGISAALLVIASSVQALYRRNLFRRKCRKESSVDSNISGITQVIDLFRTVLAEMLIYPLMICSIFSLVTSRPFATGTANDIVGLIRFALSAVSFVAFVYILRVVIIASATFKICRIRRGNVSYVMLYFFVHITLQMIVQTFMIVVTGREIYEENLHFYNASISDSNSTELGDPCLPVIVSGTLWYMIIGTYLFPIMGIIIFFVVGYYWVQEFFISIFIDMKSLLKTPTLFTIENNLTSTLDRLDRYLPQGTLEDEFDALRGACFCTKFSYPFKSPALIIACIAFLILNYLFISFGTGISGLGPFTFFSALLNFTGWPTVYFVGSIFGIFANLYAFLVGIVWLILLEIVLLFLPCILICICFCSAGSKD